MQSKIYFVGIGGIGMSALAQMLAEGGAAVSGSDREAGPTTALLQSKGIEVFIGHNADNTPKDAAVIIYSDAVHEDNPERLRAKELGIPQKSYFAMLGVVAEEKQTVAVAGTHGKTTTTSMLTVALQSAGCDPSFSIGGMINSSGTNAYAGSGDIFVAEADESDGSFLAYKPFGAIITNIELDHVDHFQDLDAIYALFVEFINSIQAGGFLVACGGDAGVQEVLSRITRTDIQIVTYGVGECDWSIDRILLSPTSSVARVAHHGKIMGELELVVPGEHNLLNALAALGAGHLLGIQSAQMTKGIGSFTGTRRRFEF